MLQHKANCELVFGFSETLTVSERAFNMAKPVDLENPGQFVSK